MQGAPADVLATASTKTMQTAQQAGRIQGEPITYATNKLQIAVQPGNPKQVTGLPSLVGPQVTESVCAPAVPCGAATEAAERAAGVTLDPVSEEQDVRSVLQRVTTGNVDAGLVYVTDVQSANGQVQGIDFPQATAQGAAQNYLIGAVTGSQNADLGQLLDPVRHRTPGRRRAHPGRVHAEVTGARTRTGAVGHAGQALPWPVWVPAVVGFGLIAVPVAGLVLRADWPRLGTLITSAAALDALRLSLETALIVDRCCAWCSGGPLALVLARSDLPGLSVWRSIVLLPLVLPPVVGGLTLLFLLGRTGPVGQLLDTWFGITVPFSTAAVVIAQTFVAMPFLVVSLEGALRTAGDRYESVAATLGASPLTTLRRVTLPVVLPGLISGAVLAFARALGEFGATVAFAGSLQGTTRTLPLLIYLDSQDDLDSAVALSLLLVVVAVLVIVATRTRDASGVR